MSLILCVEVVRVVEVGAVCGSKLQLVEVDVQLSVVVESLLMLSRCREVDDDVGNSLEESSQ